MIEPRKLFGGAFVVEICGGRAQAPLKVRCAGLPGVGEQGEAVKGLLGSWERLLFPRRKAGVAEPGRTKARASDEESAIASSEQERSTEVSEPRSKGKEKNRGSLSVFIVVLKAGKPIQGSP